MFKKSFFLVFCFLVTVLGVKESCQEKPCDDGWKLFERPSGGWCMKIFYKENIKKSAADKKCISHNATLSGLQNYLETSYVTYTVSKKIAPKSGSIWIGMKRTDRCLNSTLTSNCSHFNSFEWTDKSAEGKDGVLWGASQPDNDDLKQDCVILQAASSGYVMGMQTGTLDDIRCDYDFIANQRIPRQPMAYVCGKKTKF